MYCIPMTSAIEIVCVQLFRDNTEYQTATAAKEYIHVSTFNFWVLLCVYAGSTIPFLFSSLVHSQC